MGFRGWYTAQHLTIQAAIVSGVIGACGLVIAAVITGGFGLIGNEISATHNSAVQQSPSTPPQQALQNTTTEASQTPSPGASGTEANQSSSPGTSGDSQPPVSPSPLLSPVNQPGWRLQWHGATTAGLSGITLTSTGIFQGNGDEYDVQYGSDGSWARSYYSGSFFYWLSQSKPGPASCMGMHSNPPDGNLTDAEGTKAHIGDRYCYIGDSYTFVSYMQVTAINSDTVTLATWLWDQA